MQRGPLRCMRFSTVNSSIISDDIPDLNISLEAAVIIKPTHLANLRLYLINLEHFLQFLFHLIEIDHIERLYLINVCGGCCRHYWGL